MAEPVKRSLVGARACGDGLAFVFNLQTSVLVFLRHTSVAMCHRKLTRHATYADQPGRYAVQPLRYPPAGARCASPCNSPTCRVAAIRTIHGETTNKHPQVSTPRQARFRHNLRRWHPSPSCSASLVKQYKSPKQGVRQAFDECTPRKQKWGKEKLVRPSRTTLRSPRPHRRNETIEGMNKGDTQGAHIGAGAVAPATHRKRAPNTDHTLP